MDLSIITVTYQSEEHIADPIMSVVSSIIKLQYEHIIVDNNSSDGTVSLIESCFSNYVKLIKNSHNSGFSAANNLAVQRAQGRYLLFLNPDMKIHEGTLDAMIEWMDRNQDVGIAGCKLLDYSEKTHPALRPLRFPKMGLYLSSFLHITPFFCSIHPKLYYQNFKDDETQDVDYVRGAFMLMRREVVQKLGFAFDPHYYILLEDIDICREVKRLGYRVVYNPLMSCIDFFGRSFIKQTKSWKFTNFCKSLLTYSRKWHPWYERALIKVAIPIGFLSRIPEWGWKESLKGLKRVFHESR